MTPVNDPSIFFVVKLVLWTGYPEIWMIFYCLPGDLSLCFGFVGENGLIFPTIEEANLIDVKQIW